MSSDLKHATVAVMPLGGKNAEATIAALKAHKKVLRALVAQRVNLKFAPELRFVLDGSFAAHDAIDALLRSPRVARDCARRRRGRASGERRRRERAGARRPAPRRNNSAAPPTALEVNGWINLDKPVGVTSTQAVARLKRLLQRQEGRPRRHARSARFRRAAGRVRRGDQDRARRPGRRQGLCFVGQLGRGDRHRRRRGPGRRELRGAPEPRRDRGGVAALRRPHQPDAADLFGDQHRRRARLRPRARRRDVRDRAARGSSSIGSTLIDAGRDEARFEAECGKGAYVRALARDLGRALGCRGHVVALRRTRVGPFHVDAATALEALERRKTRARGAAAGRGGPRRIAAPRRRPQRRGDPAARAKAAAARRRRAGRGAGLRRLLRRAGRARNGRGRRFRLDAGVQPAARAAPPLPPPPFPPSLPGGERVGDNPLAVGALLEGQAWRCGRRRAAAESRTSRGRRSAGRCARRRRRRG